MSSGGGNHSVGYGKLWSEIQREGRFFGANDPLSNEVAQFADRALARTVARP